MSSDIFILTFIIYFVFSVNSEKSRQNRAGSLFYNFKNPDLANYHQENADFDKLSGLIKDSYGMMNKDGKMSPGRYSADKNVFMKVAKTKKPKTSNKESDNSIDNGKDKQFKFLFPRKQKFFSWESLEEWWKQPLIGQNKKTKGDTQWNLKKNYLKSAKKKEKWNTYKRKQDSKESKTRNKKPYKKSNQWKDKLNNKKEKASNPSFKEFF